MNTLLIPSNTELIFKCLKDLNPSEGEQFNIFIHYLILSNYYQEKVINTVGVEILSKKLTSKIFNKKSYKKILRIALGHNAIIIDNSYQVGKMAKKYRLNFLGDFTIRCYQFEFEYSINRRKFEALFVSKKKTYSEISQIQNDFIQRSFILKLKLDTKKLDDTIKTIIQEKKKENAIDIYYLNYLLILKAECYSFDFLNSFSLYDDFSGRYYHFFTNKNSAIRKCFKLNEQSLSCLDIKSSQVYFLTQLPNLDLTEFEVNKSLILIDETFKDLVLNGTIYEFFGKKLNFERNIAKVKLLSFLYGDKRLTNVQKVFEENFPLTNKTLHYLMNLNVNNSKFCFVKKIRGVDIDKNNYFNYILQSVERKVFLGALGGLKDFYTVHDSVYFEKGREDDFRDHILSYFILNKLDCPRLSEG